MTKTDLGVLAALYQDVLAAPDDDGVRLIYADYCEDGGQPERAEFVRCQVRGLPLPYNVQRFVDKRWLWQYEGVSALIHETAGNADPKHPAYGTYTWVDTLATVTTMTGGVTFTYRRGFVEEVEMPLRAWMGDADGAGAFGPRCMKSLPLKTIRTPDRVPDPTYNYWYLAGNDLSSRSYLTRHNLPVRLKPYFTREGHSVRAGVIEFANAVHAVAALSEVLLRWAKDRP